jgi:hypothetical protein
MEDEIKVNDKVYILKEKMFDKRVGIMDTANVSLVFFIEEDWVKDDIIDLPNPKMTFKSNGDLDGCNLNFAKTRIVTQAGTKISYDVYKSVSMIINGLLCNTTNKQIIFKVYEGWDNDKLEFKKDYPILLSEGNYGVIIAPRVETDK